VCSSDLSRQSTAAPSADDWRIWAIELVLGALPSPPRAGGVVAVPRAGLDSHCLLQPADPAHHPGCSDCAVGAIYDLSGVDGSLRAASTHRALDTADLAVRLGQRRGDLLDAVSPLTTTLSRAPHG